MEHNTGTDCKSLTNINGPLIIDAHHWVKDSGRSNIFHNGGTPILLFYPNISINISIISSNFIEACVNAATNALPLCQVHIPMSFAVLAGTVKINPQMQIQKMYVNQNLGSV